MPSHSQATGLELHEDKRVKAPVRAASTASVNISTPGSTMDGVTLVAGDRILLKNQSLARENGIYTWSTASTSLARAADALVASDFVLGFLVYVREGTTQAQTYWVYSTITTPIVMESTSITFKAFDAGGGTVTSVALSPPVSMVVTGSPITNNGTLALSHTSQSPNTIAAGPASGGSAAWGFRAMVAADMPLFGPSGGTHAAGAVPDPGATAGTTKFLREDRTWQVPAGSGGGVITGGSGGSGSGALVPLAAIGPITAAQSTLSFSGIPTTGFRNLVIKLSGRGTITAGGLLNAVDVGIRANNDSITNYDWTITASYQSGELPDGIQGDSAAYVTKIPASGGAPSGLAGVAEIFIPDYASTVFEKTFQAQGALKLGTSSSQQYSVDGAGFWRSTAAISDLTLLCLSGDFDIGTYACLYGEMDTAGVLLAPASNLLFERTLTAAAASIDTGTLSQAYRDLRVEIVGRGDTAATSTYLLMRVNGDTTANYDWTLTQFAGGNAFASAGRSAQGQAGTSITVGDLAASTAPASTSSAVAVYISDYTATTFHKQIKTLGNAKTNTTSSTQFVTSGAAWWRNAGAVTSLTFLPTAGNFITGTTVRVYGEPALTGVGSNGTGTRLRIASSQSLTDATDTLVLWDTEDSDADQQHYTSAAALTGTVAKTAGSQTITGTSTLFTTELSVGQVISIPGTAAEKRVVIAIANATSLTVNSALANSASGQTATRLNTPIVFRQPGFYSVKAGGYFAANATGFRKVALILNDTTVIGQSDVPNIGATAMAVEVAASQQFAQWDFVEVQVRQNSTGSLNLTADQRTFFSSTSRPTVYIQGPTFGASGSTHATGWVPDPGVTAAATRFLREDATWAIPAGTGGSSSGSAGGSGAMVPIQVIGPISAAQASLDFTAPTTGYRNLRIVYQGRGTNAAAQNIGIRLNSDTGANYDWYQAPAGVSGASQLPTATRYGILSASSGQAAAGQVYFPNFNATDFQKNFWTECARTDSNARESYVGAWHNTAAITAISVFPQAGSWGIGTYACLYGEMDTAGVLLTPASNLLYETTLTAAAATIDTGTLSQAYKDLQIEVFGRGDTAATSVAMSAQFNGDTGSTNYDSVRFFASATSGNSVASQPAASALVGELAAASAPAGQADSAIITIPGYSASTYRKTGFVTGTVSRSDTVSGNQFIDLYRIGWRSTAAITSIRLALAAGNFAAGTTVRVYGLPQSNGGSSVGTGTRTRIASNVSVADVTDTIISWDTNDSDADSQHYVSPSNLTGTSSKTAGSQTLAGSSTAYLSELSVGQVISVPGTAAEKRVVTAIASNSSLTVNAPFVNTASGQTVARVNSAIVFRSPGFYEVKAGAYWASSSGGNRKVALVLNDVTVIGQDDRVNIGATAMAHQASAAQSFQQWDFVEVQVRQSSGGALNLTADQRTFFSALSRPTVLIAAPTTTVELAPSPSNLLYDSGELTAVAATIDTGTISQSYRDLMVVIYARSDTAATSAFPTLQFSGDTGSVYDYIEQLSADQNVAQTSIHLGRAQGGTSPANTFSDTTITIPNYTNTSNHKSLTGITGVKLANSTGQMGASATTGWWRNTAAITSLKFGMSAGNFAVGSRITIYGLPANTGVGAVGTGAHLRIAGNQSIADTTDVAVAWDTEDSDADSQHYTSAANLTGTVAKTASSQTVTGTGTAFLTELSVGQVISVPGTAAEKRVVTAIASNTSLTVSTSFANTATGQTATRLNTAIVFRQGGFYSLNAGAYWATSGAGNRKILFLLNDTTTIAQDDRANIGATTMAQTVGVGRNFNQWDFVEVFVRQSSGGALNLTADERTFVSSNARPTVLVSDAIRRYTSTPVDGMTSTATNWARWSTPWQVTVNNVRAGQRVYLHSVSALSNASTYVGAAIYRVTGGPTWLAGNTIGIDLHTKPITVDYDDATPGTGTVVYEIYVAVTSGTAVMHHDAGGTYLNDNGSSLFVAEVYTPGT